MKRDLYKCTDTEGCNTQTEVPHSECPVCGARMEVAAPPGNLELVCLDKLEKQAALQP